MSLNVRQVKHHICNDGSICAVHGTSLNIILSLKGDLSLNPVRKGKRCEK